MPARPFSPAEVLTLESHFLRHGRYRDRMRIITRTPVRTDCALIFAHGVPRKLLACGMRAREPFYSDEGPQPSEPAVVIIGHETIPSL